MPNMSTACTHNPCCVSPVSPCSLVVTDRVTRRRLDQTACVLHVLWFDKMTQDHMSTQSRTLLCLILTPSTRVLHNHVIRERTVRALLRRTTTVLWFDKMTWRGRSWHSGRNSRTAHGRTVDTIQHAAVEMSNAAQLYECAQSHQRERSPRSAYWSAFTQPG